MYTSVSIVTRLLILAEETKYSSCQFKVMKGCYIFCVDMGQIQEFLSFVNAISSPSAHGGLCIVHRVRGVLGNLRHEADVVHNVQGSS